MPYLEPRHFSHSSAVIFLCLGWHGQTPLHKACLTGDLDTVQLLLSYGADPNALNDFRETPVHYASKRGIPTLVHALYQHGGKLDVVDQRGKTPVHDAAQTGSVYVHLYYYCIYYCHPDVQLGHIKQNKCLLV